MIVRSKIVGLTRQKPEATEIAKESERQALTLGPNEHEDALLLDGAQSEAVAVEADENYDWYEEPAKSSWTSYAWPVLLVTLLIGWTGFFGWAHRSELTILTSESGVALISQWALPSMLIGIVWLLVLRSSRSETNRFADAATKLRNESDALQIRMRTVNEEIAMAREFLAQNARELESVGRQSASKLLEASEKLSEALSDSDAKAKTLEQVSNAATTNLEQLRKHLPVVTSAAKDVTNQIGSAGNSAQLQVKTLIAALQRVGVAGEEARGNIDGMEERAAEASIQLSHLINKNSEQLGAAIADASSRTNELSGLLDHSTQKLAATLQHATSGLVANVDQATDVMSEKLNAEARQLAETLNSASRDFSATIVTSSTDIDELVDQNIAKLTQQVEMLRESLAHMSNQSNAEDMRIEAMISRITGHLKERGEQLEAIDETATDRSVKLAFAVEALLATSGQLTQSLAANHQEADGLVTRSERLLLALDSANRELEENLPTALSRADEQLVSSLSKMENAADKAKALETYTDDMLAKLATIEHLISGQRDSVNALMSAGDEQFAGSKQHVDALSESLAQTRSLIEELSQTADSGIMDTLERVKENARAAANDSRQIMEAEMETVREKLSQESHSALKDAINSQVAAVNGIVSQSIQNNVALSGIATEKLAEQLAHIDSMTGNLERRLTEARDSFGGIDDDSFTRQMALLTESLNSTAIDVAKILSNDVTDTSWAAYLKGDRGVFTRRAVRLLDSGEAKAILAYYDEDPEFREHVNRYIHDFESMMRALLSTRDGNAVGVTLLSSDVGKLYVALAQAIERLRTN
jgi:hypothetical protein